MTDKDVVHAPLLLLAVVACLNVAAADLAPRPTGRAVPLEVAPTLDGDVASDPAWQGMTPFTDFRQL